MRIPGRGVVLAIAFLSALPAWPALPPLRYPVSPKTTDIRALVVGGQPGRYGVSLTLEDTVTPAASGIHLWQQDAVSGRFSPLKFVPVPDVYTHIPLRLGSPLYHDVFYVSYAAPNVRCGILRGTGGVYDPTGSVIAAYPASVAPPKGFIIGHTSNFNGSNGPDVAILVEPGLVVLFKDDGTGGLDPNYETIGLPGTPADMIAVGDVTGDGLADILAGSTTPGEIVVYENTSTGGPTTVTAILSVPATGLVAMTLADLDGTGTSTLDLVALQGGTSPSVVIHRNSGTPFQLPVAVATDTSPVAIGTDDLLPLDGDTDVVVACRAGASFGTLLELDNPGTGVVRRTGQFVVGSSSSTSLANGAREFVAVHDPGDSSFTLFPMSPNNPGLSPADGIAATAGPDASASSLVRFFRGDGLWISTADVIPYASAYGARVSNGNVDGTETLHAKDELLTGPGPSPALGPHVRAFRRQDLAIVPVAKVSFYAYGTLQGGAHVAGPDIDGDDTDEIITGPGPIGVFGPHVRGFNYDGTALQAIAKVNFYAYGTLKFGVEVGNGWDGEDDGFDEIPTGPGPGPTFGPQVRGFNYDNLSLTAMARVNFTAFPAPTGYGCSVQGGDAEGDGIDELIAGRGPGPSHPAQFRGFDYDGTTVRPMQGLDIVAFPTLYGGRMAEGNLDGELVDENDDLVAGAGPDPTADATVKVYRYDGTQLLAGPTFGTIPGTTYGVNASGVFFGF